MSPRLLFLSAGTALLLLAGGCSSVVGGACHKPQPYAGAENLGPLRIPAGLNAPDTREAMLIPDLDVPEVPLDPDGPCLEAPPALTAPPLPPSGIDPLPDLQPLRSTGRTGPRPDADSRQGDEESEAPRRRRPPSRPR